MDTTRRSFLRGQSDGGTQAIGAAKNGASQELIHPGSIATESAVAPAKGH